MNRSLIHKNLVGALLSTVALAVALPIVPANADQQIETVMVTARKREESILKVPVIETAISGQSLRQFGTHDLKGLSAQVPSLMMGSATGAFGVQVSIRGVGTTTLNAAIDQSVSLNLDGLQITQGLAYSVGMFDSAQVQVLKGPQALFYGKSSTGGVIAIRSKDPTDQTEITLQGSHEFEADENSGELILSGPVSDTLKLRLAAKYSHSAGFFTNAAIGNPAYGGLTPRYRTFAPKTAYMLRGTAIWTPTSKIDTRLKVNYDKTRIDGDGGGLEMVSCPGGTAPSAGLLTAYGAGFSFLSPQDNCQLNRTIYLVDANPKAFPYASNNGVPYSDLWLSFGSYEVNYHPNQDLTLTSVSGYFLMHQSNLINGTLDGYAGPAIMTDNKFFRRDYSEELRLNSEYDGPFNYTVGGLYEDGYIREDLNGEMNTMLGLPAFFQKGYDQIGIHTISFFGQARYKILPDVELAAGARWTHEWRTFKETNTITGTPVVVPMSVPKLSSYHLSPAFTVTYTPTNDLTFFGSYKEASQSGSFDTTIIQAAGSNPSFGDESVKGGEVGMKGYFFDRHASFTLSGYYYDYSNLQVGANQVVNGTVIDRTVNAASANIRGIEGSGTYIVDAVQGLTLNGAFDWNHARYTAFNDALCWGGQTVAEGCNQQYNSATGLYTGQNLTGRPLLRAPNFTASFGFTYATPVLNGMTLTLGSNTHYSTSYQTDLVERSDSLQASYFKTDASISLLAPDGSWEVALIGRDLNNELTTGNCVNAPFRDGVALAQQTTGGLTSGPSGPDAMACNVDRGREVWLRVTLHPLQMLHG